MNNIWLHSYTILNSYLYTIPIIDSFGERTEACMGQMTSDSEAICEWAARVCYKSTDRFGQSPDFLNGLMKVQHYDVIEHANVSFGCLINEDNSSYYWGQSVLTDMYPYLNIYRDGGRIFITANLRVWRDIVVTNRSHYLFDMMLDMPYDVLHPHTPSVFIPIALNMIAPSLFPEVAPEDYGVNQDVIDTIKENVGIACNTQRNLHTGQPIEHTDTGASVLLLGFSPLIANIGMYKQNKILHATFQIDNVSRAMTHQHVRHRLLSHCLAPDTMVYSFGQKKWTIEELYNWQFDEKLKGRLKLIKLRGMNENKEIVPVTIKNIIYSGKQQVYRLTTKSGRTIRATQNHRFLTESGWKMLGEIQAGENVYSNGIPAYKDIDYLRKRYLEENLAFRDKIVSIIADEVVDTYDIEVNEDIHNFIADGMVVHNSQESQRYVDLDKMGTNIVYPPGLTQEQRQEFRDVMDYLSEKYRYFRSIGLKKEDARAILPNCTTTKIVSSSYWWGWKHYLDLRTPKDAQYEIRQVALAIQKILNKLGMEL